MRIRENSTTRISRGAEDGATLVEMLIVVIFIGILSMIAIPQMVGSRRMIRSAAFNRQVMTQLRSTRQRAMTERRPYTLQYNDATKQLNIISHPAGSATALMGNASYPMTTGSVQVATITLTDSGLPAGEMVYGRPPLAPTAALSDGTTLTAMPASNKINITFQPDGSVVDAGGNPANFGLYFYNTKAIPTAGAITVLGSAGRVKLWRYDSNANSWIE